VIDGQTERTNQILEDMLRACALKNNGSLDKSLPCAEFAYNSSYQSRIKMAPFEALYGRKCSTLLFWNQTCESQLFGPDSIREVEKQVEIIKENLKAAQSRQKSYVDPRRREVVLEVGDYAYLRVSPIRGPRRFNLRGKLSPRFIRPFKIVERKGEVAYQLELPAQLSGVHDLFHVSLLKKCTSEVKIEPVQLEDIQMENDLTYKEYPVKILDTSERVIGSKIIRMCKVQWSHHTEEEATWEREDELKEDFPQLLDEILFKGVGFVTP
jgi:hypothetical protein